MDALTKSIMHESLWRSMTSTKVTIFFITHDLEGAIFLGDRVVDDDAPAKTKKIVDVDIKLTSRLTTLSSNRFRELVEETKDVVHEERPSKPSRPASGN